MLSEIFLVLIAAILFTAYSLYGGPQDWILRKKRITELERLLPQKTLKKRDYGLPDGSLTSFDIYDENGKHVGYYMFTNNEKWEKLS